MPFLANDISIDYADVTMIDIKQQPKNTVLQELCSKYGIEESPENGNIGRGWESIVENCFRRAKEIGASCEYSQIKEKFGELRIYRKNSLQLETTVELEHRKIIDAACEKSSLTCVVCGKSGHIRVVHNWWRQCFCDCCHERAIKIWTHANRWELFEELLQNGK